MQESKSSFVELVACFPALESVVKLAVSVSLVLGTGLMSSEVWGMVSDVLVCALLESKVIL